MKKPVMFFRDFKKKYRVVVEAIPSWDEFDKLILFVQKYYHAEVLEQYDGPGSRRWILKSGETIFELIHDDFYGNYFLSPSSESENLVRQIGEDLERRLKNT